MAYSIDESCIGCGMCRRSCPVHAIDGELKAKHSIRPVRCVECGVCGKVCPTKSVRGPSGEICEKIPKDKWLRPRVDKTKCSACRMCVAICPFGVLDITLPEFIGDVKAFAFTAKPEKCVGCGLCFKECPLKAITMGGAEQ